MAEAVIEYKKGSNPSPEALKFLENLNTEKRVIFDWCGDTLWVVEGGDETDEKNISGLNAEEFHNMTEIPALTSADTVASLLGRGLEVQVRNFQGSLRSGDEIINRLRKQFQSESIDVAKLSFQ